MILKILDYFGFPLRQNLRVSDVHGKDKARKKETRAIVAACPMTIIELERLIKGETIDCSRVKVVRMIQHRSILARISLSLTSHVICGLDEPLEHPKSAFLR
jgi:hypothetical protein